MSNTIQFESVTFTVGGSNPQQKTVQVAFSVDPITGIGTAATNFTYTGANSGVDTVTATLPAFNQTSNPATVAWQQANGLISVGDQISVGVIHNGQSNGFNVSSPVPFAYSLVGHSLLMQEGFPSKIANLTAQGADAGTSVPLQNATATLKDGDNTIFKTVSQGTFVVSQAGNYTFNAIVDDSILLGVQGATRLSGTLNNPYGQTVTPYRGFPILMAWNGRGPEPGIFVSLNFPAPGLYPFELDYNNWGRVAYSLLRYNGSSNIRPVTLLTAPAQPSAGNGPLILTPTGGPANLRMQSQQVTLNLTLKASFLTQPYIPLLEGSVGQIYVYNDPITPTFSFETYYGVTPDGPTAAANDFSLVGDNAVWQGQVGLRWDSGVSKFELFYNGSQSLAVNQLFAPNIDRTTLTITQEDIAWFNTRITANVQGYDLFEASSAGGGKFANIPVFYLLNPNFPASASVQVSPTIVNANGTAKTFTVTLARPLPPLQNNTRMGVTFSGTQPTGIVTVTPNLATIAGIPNWLVSYTVTATWPSAAVASSSTMHLAFTAPSITFLGLLGMAIDQFTTLTNYTYAGPTPAAVITLQASDTVSGVGNTPAIGPAHVRFQELSVEDSNSQLRVIPPIVGITAHTTLIATWTSPSNNFGITMFYITPGGAPRIPLGGVSAPHAVITSIGGGRYQAVYTLTATDTILYQNNNAYRFSYLGACTDGSSVSYVDTTNYSSANLAPNEA